MKIKVLNVRVRPNDNHSTRKTRVHFFIEGSEYPADKSVRLRAYRSTLKEVGDKCGLQIFGAKWNARLGCRCGCSPGFQIENITNGTIFVDVAFSKE